MKRLLKLEDYVPNTLVKCNGFTGTLWCTKEPGWNRGFVEVNYSRKYQGRHYVKGLDIEGVRRS